MALATLGCKANQYESGRIAADFAAHGCEVVDDIAGADILVVNTCTVTNTADSKSRRQIRHLKRVNPNAVVVATGCGAEIDPEGLRAATGIDMVFTNRGKATLVGNTIAFGKARGLTTLAEDTIPANVAACRLPSLGRTRALLMVQDGCSFRCSYCIIPKARPVRVSRPMEEAVAEARSLVEKGYREIVLTGISIGSWHEAGRHLPDLVRSIAAVPGLAHLRMSSIEPKTVTPALIAAFAELPQCCRHFHIPLQAGDDATLKAMNRHYTTAAFARLIDDVRAAMPDAGISTDVITGFPTETDEQFEQTVRFCTEIDFCKIHVFPFSPRAGTPAAAIPDTTGPERRKQRTARLIALSDEGAHRWAERQIGKTHQVVTEPRDPHTGLYSGLSGNYVRVHWASDTDMHGQVARVRVVSARNGECYGELV